MQSSHRSLPIPVNCAPDLEIRAFIYAEFISASKKCRMIITKSKNIFLEQQLLLF
jgi:hypothetical protein